METKHLTDAIIDHTGMAAACFWLLCLLFVDFLLKHLALDAIGGLTPIKVMTGQRPDASPLLQFCWFAPILYYAKHSFVLTDSPEKT
jgi:hypothetical protein